MKRKERERWRKGEGEGERGEKYHYIHEFFSRLRMPIIRAISVEAVVASELFEKSPGVVGVIPPFFDVLEGKEG